MKTLIIATSQPGNSITDYFHALANGFNQIGWKVIIIYDQNPGNLPPSETTIIFYKWPNKRPTHFSDFVFFFKLCRKYKPDAVLANFGATNTVLLVSYFTCVRNRIVYWHTMRKQLEYDRSKSGLLQKFHFLRKALLLKITTTDLLTNSKANKQELKNEYRIQPDSIHVFHPLITDYSRKVKYKEQFQTRQICCVGRLDKSKGQEVLINEAKCIFRNIPNSNIVLIGTGPEELRLKEMVHQMNLGDRIFFKGQLNSKEVFDLMNQSWVHVSASREEAFGLVNIEALRCGLPILAPNTGGIRDILVDGLNGYFYNPEVDGDLCQKLSLLEGTDYDIWSFHARQTFLEKFSYERIPDQITRLNQLMR